VAHRPVQGEQAHEIDAAALSEGRYERIPIGSILGR
jgi:hypothetical protein